MKAKQWISTMLAVTMAGATATSLTGCGASSTAAGSDTAAQATAQTADGASSTSGAEEPVTLHVYMWDPIGTDDEKVEEALNEIPEVKALNVKIDVVKYTEGAYTDKVALALASDEPMDLVFDAGWIAYQSRVDSGAYLDLTSMLDTVASTLKSTLPQALWDGVKVNGKIYAVPTYKEMGEQWGVYAETDFLTENKVDTSNIHCLADADVILKSLKGTDRAGFEVYGNSTDVAKMAEMETYDVLADAVAAKKDAPDTLVNYYDTDDFATFCDMMRGWYNDGYIASDVATRTSYDEFDRNGNYKKGMTYVSYSPQNEVAKSAEYGKELSFFPTTGITLTTGACTGSLYAIPSKSKNPEKALQFLEVWNTVPAVKNMMCYGIEGVHYNLVDGQVERVEGATDMWSGQNWTTGNCMISYTTTGETKDKWQQYEAFNAKAANSCFLGFSVDNAAVEDKVSTVNATITEYLPLLNTGAVDPAEYLPQFRSALKAAGIDDIVAEYQKQYDAWRK